jgi:hypothetical protein
MAFCGGPTFEICRKYGWQHMIGLKDQESLSVTREFAAQSKSLPPNLLSCGPAKDAAVSPGFRWVEKSPMWIRIADNTLFLLYL